MTLYAEAARTIRDYSTQKQVELEAEFTKAHIKKLEALRKLAISGVEEDAPERAICDLVANTITVNEKDSQLEVALPRSTKQALAAAAAAEMLPLHDRQQHYPRYFLIGELEWRIEWGQTVEGNITCELDNAPTDTIRNALTAFQSRNAYRRKQIVDLL
jgi:hypothetical protein